jgi:hypothetical protein
LPAWQRRCRNAIRILSEAGRACGAALLLAPCRAEGLKREQLKRLMHPRRSSRLPVIRACAHKGMSASEGGAEIF